MKNYLTDTSSISTKYQTVIPQKIRDAAQLKVHQELTWQLVDSEKGPILLAVPSPKKWSVYLSGLGKNVWSGVNTTSYLKRLKSEWRA